MQNINTQEIVEGYRLSPQQKHLWLLQHDDMQPYHGQCIISIGGNVDISLLNKALQNVVNQHEILRTNFCCLPGTIIPFQVINENNTLPIDYHDFSSLPLHEQEAKIAAIPNQNQWANFNFEESSLLHIFLIKLSSNQHILVISLSAIIADKASMSNLMHEISQNYEACLQNQEISQEILQYADIAEWHYELLEGEEGKLGRAYWHQKNISEFLNVKLPFENQLWKSTEAFLPDILTATIHPNYVDRIKDLVQKYDTSIPVFLLTCWQILLWHLHKNSDMIIGTAYDGRKYEELQPALGLFAKYLPIGTHLEKNLPFNQVLQQLNQAVIEGYKWQDYFNCEQNNQDLQSSFLPFCFEFTEPLIAETAGEILFSLQKQYVCFDRFKIKLSGIFKNDNLIAEFHYDSSIFSREDIQGLIEQFQKLLESAISHPEALIGDLEILSDRQRHQLLFEFNNTHTDYDRSQSIQKLFEAQVERTPNNIAVVFQEQKITYSELNTRANQLAHYLQELGVKPEVVVGICVERSLEMIIGILAILKAGGAYLPLDPAYPQERLAFILDDTQISILLTQERILKDLPEHKAKIICLDTEWEGNTSLSQANLAVEMIGENLAYIIYTSGSTGKPKGVQITHQNLVHSTNSRFNYYQEPVTNFLLISSFSFDSSIAGIFWTLCSGGSLIFPQEGGEQDIPELLNLICQHHVSHLLSLPSLYNLLLEQAKSEQLVSLRAVIVAGESCPIELVINHQQLLPETSLFNEYGPTEATVWSSVYNCQSSELTTQISIGRPITNTQIYLLDDNLSSVPLGVAGEVYISGDGLARGYLNRPDLTAQRFIPNPFSSNESGLRLYKTGDLARYLRDGNIEFLGRIDQQVKIRGFRIELGEIEAVLAQHPGVRSQVVIAREDSPGNTYTERSRSKRLVAYIVPSEQPINLKFSDLRHFLQERLPEYMVPSAFVRIGNLPRLPNGKIDLKALPIPETVRSELSGTFIAPQTFIEEKLAEIWSQVLRVEQVGIQDNFFELGGDSILSIQIVARANQVGLRLTPKQVFDHQTIAELAAVVDTTDGRAAQQELLTGQIPLTPIQHWFFAQNQPDSHHWNQAVLLEMQQVPDPQLLEQVVQHLIKHHDSLRLRFILRDSGWEQSIANPDEMMPFTSMDLSALPELEQKIAIETAAAELQGSLNLSQGPILQVAFFKLAPHQSNRLLIVIHHLAVDGVSWRILLEDLQLAYQQISQGQAIHLPNKTTSFQQWALRLLEYAQSAELIQEQNYWLAQPQKPVSLLPVDFSGGDNTEAEADTVLVSLNQKETQALLQEVHKAYNTQINDLLLTALVQAFTEWTGEQSLLLYLEGHGREDIFADVDLSRTVGWFTTHFPVLLDVKDATPDTLKAVKEQLRRIPNRGLGYGVLRYLNSDGEINSRLQTLPQAEVIFNYLGQTDQLMSESSLFAPTKESPGAVHSPRGRRVYLLAVTAIVTGGQLQVNWTYSEIIHHRTTIENLAASFIKALRSLISHCQSPQVAGYTPSDFPKAKLNQQDLDKFLAKFNQKS